ncbi:MAG TPA: fibronectin type III-like domain-contianing protein, partial [Mobilitalea sp.]|nr:fibronectin type III-like domain-contianing protein [Mobilitalea sp.]
NKPLYPFGYGLSYTDFTIDRVQADTDAVTEQGIGIHLHIANTGRMKARDTVQVYIKAERPDTPNPQLKAFVKIELEAGEEKDIHIHLPQRAFSLCDAEGRRWVEPGIYTVYVGDSQPDARSMELTGKQPSRLLVQAANKVEI